MNMYKKFFQRSLTIFLLGFMQVGVNVLPCFSMGDDDVKIVQDLHHHYRQMKYLSEQAPDNLTEKEHLDHVLRRAKAGEGQVEVQDLVESAASVGLKSNHFAACYLEIKKPYFKSGLTRLHDLSHAYDGMEFIDHKSSGFLFTDFDEKGFIYSEDPKALLSIRNIFYEFTAQFPGTSRGSFWYKKRIIGAFGGITFNPAANGLVYGKGNWLKISRSSL